METEFGSLNSGEDDPILNHPDVQRLGLTKGKVQESGEFIKPTEAGIWMHAALKLQQAEAAIPAMRDAMDRISYELAWADFVRNLYDFWQAFYHDGKTEFSDFQPWAGRIKHEIQGDPLLNYLWQCRHVSQHDRLKLEWEEPTIEMGKGFCGTVSTILIMKDGTTYTDAKGASPGSEFKIEQVGGKAQLGTIVNNKVTFVPPCEFLGEKINRDPLQTAVKALAYYIHVFLRAQGKFVLRESEGQSEE